MNKEIVIHVLIGIAAVGTIYWLYTRLKPSTSAANPSSPNSPDYNGIWDTSPVY